MTSSKLPLNLENRVKVDVLESGNPFSPFTFNSKCVNWILFLEQLSFISANIILGQSEFCRPILGQVWTDRPLPSMQEFSVQIWASKLSSFVIYDRSNFPHIRNRDISALISQEHTWKKRKSKNQYCKLSVFFDIYFVAELCNSN